MSLTNVDVGKPLILTAKEQGLRIPSSVSKLFDVYWVQLAVNPHADLRGKFDELSFFVSLDTPHAEALELVPLRLGQEQDVTKKTETPDVKIKAGDVGISLGQIYSQEVSFKTLKPTIVGTGIQDTKFGWSLSDDMLDMSAKRLIAVIGVPHKSSKIEFEMILTAKTNPRDLGFVQGNVASSEPQKFSEKLPSAR